MTDVIDMYIFLAIGFVVIAYLIFGRKEISWSDTAMRLGFSYRENPNDFELADGRVLRWVIEGEYQNQDVLMYEDQQKVRSYYTLELKSKEDTNFNLSIYSNKLFPNGLRNENYGEKIKVPKNPLNKIVNIHSHQPEHAEELFNNIKLQKSLKELFKFHPGFIIDGNTIRFVSKINLAKNMGRLRYLLDSMSDCLIQIESLSNQKAAA